MWKSDWSRSPFIYLLRILHCNGENTFSAACDVAVMEIFRSHRVRHARTNRYTKVSHETNGLFQATIHPGLQPDKERRCVVGETVCLTSRRERENAHLVITKSLTQTHTQNDEISMFIVTFTRPHTCVHTLTAAVIVYIFKPLWGPVHTVVSVVTCEHICKGEDRVF